MGEAKRKLVTLRRRASRCIEAQFALALFSCGIVQVRADRSKALQWVSHASHDKLQRQIRRCERQIKMVRQQLGASAPNDTYVDYLRDARQRNYRYVLHPKWYLFGLMNNLGSLIPPLAEFPEHTLIRLYLRPEESAGGVAVEWLEENAYNDMVVAWNKALASHDAAIEESERGPRTGTGPKHRDHIAFVRLTIQAALRFLEAFVNGAAAHWLSLYGDDLDDSVLTLLLEWDVGKKRPKYFSLAEKIVKYSRIFGGSDNSAIPLTHPDVQYLDSTAARVRNALTHPSIRPKGVVLTIDIGDHHLGHRLEVAERIVDVCIRLASQMSELAYTSRSWLKWLQPRMEGGYFEPATSL